MVFQLVITFVNDSTVRDEIWALGLRHPWRLSFDSSTGDLWIADVGWNTYEEINYEPMGFAGGANYDWNCFEGDSALNKSNCGSYGEYSAPLHQYHNPTDGKSITGGFVYRGSKCKKYYGDYIFADFWHNIRGQ